MHFADFQRFFIGHLWKRWHDTKKGPKLSMRTIFYHVTISFGLKSFEIGQPLHNLQKLGSQSIFLNNRMGFQVLTPEIFVLFLQSSMIRASVFHLIASSKSKIFCVDSEFSHVIPSLPMLVLITTVKDLLYWDQRGLTRKNADIPWKIFPKIFLSNSFSRRNALYSFLGTQSYYHARHETKNSHNLICSKYVVALSQNFLAGGWKRKIHRCSKINRLNYISFTYNMDPHLEFLAYHPDALLVQSIWWIHKLILSLMTYPTTKE